MRVRDLFVYPLKSGAGIRLDAGPLDGFGLAGDRRWMVVDAEGRFLSQRELPRMALLRVAAHAGALVVSAPDMPALVADRPDRQDAARRRTVKVWDDVCDGLDTGDAAAAWMRAFLGRDCRLVYAADDVWRPVDRVYASNGERVAFSDGFPLLVVGQSSLDELNARLAAKGEAPVPMDRFRPNLVIEGAMPHAEDTWRQIIVGPPDAGIRLEIVKPCARCAIVAVDQATGLRGKEPLLTLAAYRKRAGHVYFGQNALHRETGTLRVGDPVRVVS